MTVASPARRHLVRVERVWLCKHEQTDQRLGPGQVAHRSRDPLRGPSHHAREPCFDRGRAVEAASSSRTSAGARSCRCFSSRFTFCAAVLTLASLSESTTARSRRALHAVTRRRLRKTRSSRDTPAYVTQQENDRKGCLQLRIGSCSGQTLMNRQPMKTTREHR